jgi:hypothetical protein
MSTPWTTRTSRPHYSRERERNELPRPPTHQDKASSGGVIFLTTRYCDIGGDAYLANHACPRYQPVGQQLRFPVPKMHHGNHYNSIDSPNPTRLSGHVASSKEGNLHYTMCAAVVLTVSSRLGRYRRWASPRIVMSPRSGRAKVLV